MKPDYVQYPRYRQADISMSLIGDAWEYIKNNMGAYVGFSAIVLIFGFLASTALQGPDQFAAPDPLDPYRIYRAPMYWVGNAVSAFFQYLFFAGTIRMALKELRGERASIKDGFGIFGEGIGSILAAAILTLIATYVGLALCIAPGIAVSVLLIVTFPAIMDQKLSAIDAMTWSYNAVKGHFWKCLGLIIVGGIVSGLGICACCVGFFFTVPIYAVMVAMIYHQLRWEETEGMGAKVAWTSDVPGQTESMVAPVEEPRPESSAYPTTDYPESSQSSDDPPKPPPG